MIMIKGTDIQIMECCLNSQWTDLAVSSKPGMTNNKRKHFQLLRKYSPPMREY